MYYGVLQCNTSDVALTRKGNNMKGKWEICCNCDGNGKHSRHLGCYTQEDLDEMSDDEIEYYMNGGYDVTCSVCRGTGKVRAEDNRVEQYYDTDEEYYRNREGGY